MTVIPAEPPIARGEPIGRNRERVDPRAAIDAANGPLSLSEILDLIVALVDEGVVVRDAVREVRASHDIDPDDAANLIDAGLMARVGAILSQRRRMPLEDDESDQTYQVRGMTPRERKDALRRLVMEVADGTQKAAARWTLADCEYLHRYAASQANGWGRRSTALLVAIDHLSKSKALTIAELPKASREQVRRAFDEAWS